MALIRRFPLTLQTSYADLVARLEAESVHALGGSPVCRTRRGQRYWYVVQRVGNQTVDRYLGPDTPEIRERVAQARHVQSDLKQQEAARRPLVRMCREGGLPAVDAQSGKVLRALAQAGVFRLRCVLVGTHAFRCYPGLLGVDVPEAHAVTEDIDLAAFPSVAVALDDRIEPVLSDALRAIGPFVAQPGLHRHPTSWHDPHAGTRVELLAANEGPDRDAPIELPTLGVHATPLRFLDYLIHRPVSAAVLYRSGLLVNVPRPERYAVHKLIVAPRRAASAQLKSRKDIEQAAALIRVLAQDRPDDLADALAEALDRGPSWRDVLSRGRGRLPADAAEMLANLPA